MNDYSGRNKKNWYNFYELVLKSIILCVDFMSKEQVNYIVFDEPIRVCNGCLNVSASNRLHLKSTVRRLTDNVSLTSSVKCYYFNHFLTHLMYDFGRELPITAITAALYNQNKFKAKARGEKKRKKQHG